MKLDELEWREYLGPKVHRAKNMPVHDGYLTIFRWNEKGIYNVYHTLHGGLYETWYSLDALTAQCVLNHLTQGGNCEFVGDC